MKKKLIRYEKDIIAKAKANHIWLNGFACIKPSDDLLIQVGRVVINQLNNDKNLILDEYKEGKELILRINKS